MTISYERQIFNGTDRGIRISFLSE